MSIAIIDYIGNVIQTAHLPISAITLIICNENTLVPSSLGAVLLSSIDRNTIAKGGLFIFRAGTELDKGCNIGLAYGTFPNSKLYTSRPDLFSGIVPNNSLETLVQPFHLQKTQNQKVAESSKSLENTIFEEVYSESLEKFSKTFLLIPAIRAYKIKSLKAQLKNLVDGVIMSKARKLGKVPITSENVVQSIFEDLEKQELVKNSFGNVEYCDGLIERFFGSAKSAVFIPGHRQKSSGCVRQVGDAGQNLKAASQITSATGTRLPGSFPVYQSPSNTSIESLIQPILLLHRPIETTQNDEKSSSIPSRTQECPIDQTIQRNQNNITHRPADFDWSSHDAAISIQIIDEIGNSGSIDSCLKLFRLCNRIIREYLESQKIEASPEDFNKRITKALRLGLETFFLPDSSLSPEEIASCYKDHLNIKLTKND
jgi:hypothetical protein